MLRIKGDIRLGVFAPIVLTAFFAACTAKMDLPTDFPTPEPPPAATPIPKLQLRTDPELETQIAKIAEESNGRVGVAAVVLETGQAAFVNGDQHFPMQSVYKLPIAMAVMEQVKLGNLDLDEQIGVTQADFVRRGYRSPLRDQNPSGGAFSIRELIRLALVESDGTANDELLRLAGGPPEVQSYLTQIGIEDVKVVNSEAEISRDWETQYQNWATPKASVELLRWLDASVKTGSSSQQIPAAGRENESSLGFVMQLMADSHPGGRRIKGLLPKGTVVAHKTGTGGSKDGIYAAINDIGIIDMPNGKHIAIAVFVSDSPGTDGNRETMIAKIAKAAWDRWNS